MSRQIFEVLEGNAAGGAHIVMAGNPSQTSGTFFDAFHQAADDWHKIQISGEESPNVREGRIVVPGLATREWVEERRRAWGEDSDLYRVRVKGGFPKQASNAVIGLEVVREARERWEEVPAEGSLSIGVDPAFEGADETVIFPRRGRKLLMPTVVHGLDPVEVAHQVVEVARAHIRGIWEPIAVNVDAIGLGSGVVAHLDRWDTARQLGIEVHAIKASESATRGGRDGEPAYKNLRAQLWFEAGVWLKAGGAIPPVPRLDVDLVTPTYRPDARDQLQVESKREIRSRLGRSPDYGDAFCLAVYLPPSAPTYKGLTGVRMPGRRM